MAEAFAVRVERAVAWFESHRDAIEAALPLAYPGGEYLPERPGPEGTVYRSAVAVVVVWAQLWRTGDLSNCLAQAYLLEPIRHMYKAMEDRGDGEDTAKAQVTCSAADGLDTSKENTAKAG